MTVGITPQKEVPGSMKAEELLLNCISHFNMQLREKSFGVQLKDNDKLFKLHIAKKNGKPKDDLPRIRRILPYSHRHDPDHNGHQLRQIRPLLYRRRPRPAFGPASSATRREAGGEEGGEEGRETGGEKGGKEGGAEGG